MHSTFFAVPHAVIIFLIAVRRLNNAALLLHWNVPRGYVMLHIGAIFSRDQWALNVHICIY